MKARAGWRVVEVLVPAGGELVAGRAAAALRIVAGMVAARLADTARRCVRCGQGIADGKRIEAVFCSRRCKERTAQDLRRARPRNG